MVYKDTDSFELHFIVTDLTYFWVMEKYITRFSLQKKKYYNITVSQPDKPKTPLKT